MFLSEKQRLNNAYFSLLRREIFTWKKKVSEDPACSSGEGAHWWLSTLVISISLLMTCWLLKSHIRQRSCLLIRILSKHCPLLPNTLVYLILASLFMSQLCAFLWLPFYCCTTSVLPSICSFITVVECYLLAVALCWHIWLVICLPSLDLASYFPKL